jgi:transcriptional regulator with XRE-family HTH domain
MTQIGQPISDVIGDRIRDLRTRAGMSRAELAEAAQAAGAPGTFTAAVVGFLESGRRSSNGARTRHFLVDELLALAAALEVSPSELLGGAAVLFAADDTAQACPNCGGTPGPLETTARADIKALAALTGIEASLAATAYVLARAVDAGGGEDGRQLPALTKEFRACLEQIAAGRRGVEEPDEDDEFGDLDSPAIDDLDAEGPDVDGPD